MLSKRCAFQVLTAAMLLSIFTLTYLNPFSNMEILLAQMFSKDFLGANYTAMNNSHQTNFLSRAYTDVTSSSSTASDSLFYSFSSSSSSYSSYNTASSFNASSVSSVLGSTSTYFIKSSTTPASKSTEDLSRIHMTSSQPPSNSPYKQLPSDVSRYVSFSGRFADGRRLGNQIFCFAAVLYVAELTNREPAIEKFNYVIELDKVFELNVKRFDSLCPCFNIGESKHLAFDEATDRKVLNNPEVVNKSILVSGFRQSWRYTLAIERRLRRFLTFREEIRKFADDFLEGHIPKNWSRAGFIRVAIHVRRGDILKKSALEFGYTVPNASYFEKAMKYFIDRYDKIQFLTFSDDPQWTRDNINANDSMLAFVNVTHVSGNSAGQDLAIMSLCDHVIMSSGTYGWWAAWLAKGTTMYYSNWPRKGSRLETLFVRRDFFPPSWIPMTN